MLEQPMRNVTFESAGSSGLRAGRTTLLPFYAVRQHRCFPERQVGCGGAQQPHGSMDFGGAVASLSPATANPTPKRI